MDNWLNIGVIGGAIWPTTETRINFEGYELILKPATRETEQSIHINLKNISDLEAMTLINRFLSILSWCDDQGMQSSFAWSGNPFPNAVIPRSRTIGSSIAFPFNRCIEKNQKARLGLALYREGRTVNSIPFSFLSYFKILNIFWRDKYVNRKNALIEGIRDTLPKINDEESLSRLSVLQKTEPDVPNYLYESGRCAIAHAFSDPIVDPDELSDLRRLSQDIWIIKAIAEYLIESELKVSRSILG